MGGRRRENERNVEGGERRKRRNARNCFQEEYEKENEKKRMKMEEPLMIDEE